jgi:hypothetical protein
MLARSWAWEMTARSATGSAPAVVGPGRGIHSRANNASWSWSVSTLSWSRASGLLTSEPTYNTAAPAGSTISTDTPPEPGTTRTRTTLAPLARNTT